MGADQYQVKNNRNKTTFLFTSEGPKGKILKRIIYSKTKIPNIRNVYNLGFGDALEQSDDFDDNTITDNGDRDKILATVINSIYLFIEKRPNAAVFFAGSTPSRTRLYQIVINKYFDEYAEDFDIQGLTRQGFVRFEKNTRYYAFLITRKIQQL